MVTGNLSTSKEAARCRQSVAGGRSIFSPSLTARFDGGTITSDAGGLLLREVEAQTGLLADLARCFDDHRDPELIEHSVEELIKQRVFALALGYEDLNDHDQLRSDPLLATLVGKADVTGQERFDPRDRGKPLAGKSTLNRLELTPARATAQSRYKKIVARQQNIAEWFVQAFLRLQPQPPEEIILDLDATDDPIHGIKRAGSSTATTTATATCRSTSSAASTCSWPSCGRRLSTRRRGASSKSPGSSSGSAKRGPTYRSSSAATAASAART